jgi:hypothetical protein
MSARTIVIDVLAMALLASAWMMVLRFAWRRFGVPGARRGRI